MADRRDNGDSAPWLAFLLGAIMVVVTMTGYLIYAGQGYDAMRTARLEGARPGLHQPAAPDIPITLPAGK